MKRIIVLLALIAVVSLGIAWSCYPSSQPQVQPKKPTQDITVVYGYMTFSEAEYLGCVQVQAGWACQLTGAGGGHAFKD